MKRKKPETDRRDSQDATSAARLMAELSVEARKKKWGTKEFLRKMRQWGRQGGRPKSSGKKKGGAR